MNRPGARSVARPAHGLYRNVLAGVRLALFLRITPLDYRVSPADFAVLVACVAVAACAGSFVRGGLPGYFDFAGVSLLLAEVSIVLLTCLIITAIIGRRELLLALATALFASDPFFEVVATALWFGTDPLPVSLSAALRYAYLLWALTTTLRALVVFAGRRGIRTACAGGVLVAMFLAFVFALPRSEFWVHVDSEAEEAATQPSIAEERLFHRQQTLLGEALAALAPQRPGIEDLYFVGVAAYSSQDVFVREVSAVRKMFDERFGTAGRSIVLANSPATLTDMPIATSTNLRTVLERVGRVLDPDEDMLFLFITTHGDKHHELAFELPPLELQQLTPTALGRMLNDSGIKWKVLVVSACYSGGFVEPLKDANSVVITAADDKSSSFGCASGRDFTYFGRAYFNDALANTFSFTDAFEAAKRSVSEQEQAEHLAPSSPQIWIGDAIRPRLAALEQRLRTAR